MSASRTGRPRAACRSTNRAAVDRRAGVRGAADHVGPDPAAGDDDRPQLTGDLEQLHEGRVADLVDQPVHVEAGTDRPRAVR